MHEKSSTLALLLSNTRKDPPISSGQPIIISNMVTGNVKKSLKMLLDPSRGVDQGTSKRKRPYTEVEEHSKRNSDQDSPHKKSKRGKFGFGENWNSDTRVTPPTSSATQPVLILDPPTPVVINTKNVPECKQGVALKDRTKRRLASQRTDEALQHFFSKEEVSSEQQERSPSLGQEDPEPPQIKEEQEEPMARRGHWVEYLHGMEEEDITKLTFTPVPAKSENHEGKPPSSELNQTQTEEDGKRDPLPNTSTAQMKTEPDGEYAWLLSSDCSGTGMDDCGEWEESGGAQSGLNTLKSKKMENGQSLSISKMFKKAVEHLDPTENFQLNVQAHRRTCNVCGERCTCNLDFQKNLHVPHTREKHFSCTVCGIQFAEKGNLKVHMRKHTGEKPFSCTVCGKAFGKKGNLTVHMRNHTGEKPFSCAYCSKSFRTTTTLKVHMRTHTGEKPFGCTVCGKRFRQSSTVTIHMRSHTGEKPFSCSTCGKRFAESGILRRHMKIHTGEKPYSCSICKKRFIQFSHVKKHNCCTE